MEQLVWHHLLDTWPIEEWTRRIAGLLEMYTQGTEAMLLHALLQDSQKRYVITILYIYTILI